VLSFKVGIYLSVHVVSQGVAWRLRSSPLLDVAHALGRI